MPATTSDPPATPPSTRPPAPATTTAPAAQAGTAAGRYPLAGATLPLVDASRPTVSRGHTIAATRALTTLVWRPAVPGRWPLIVFCHGFQVGPQPYTALLQAWASAGYVVAAPEFPLTDQAIAGAALDENDIDNQPADVRFVLDSLVGPGSGLAAHIDRDRVVFAGHSDGAETALAASTDSAPPGEPSAKAVLAMAVSPLPGATHTANPPLLLTQGTDDSINPPSLGQQTYREAAAPKYYMTLAGGGHLPPVEAGSPWLAAIEATSLQFFQMYLYGGTPGALLAAGTRPGLTSISAG